MAPRFLGTSVTLLLAGAISATLAVGWLAIVALPVLVLAALGGIALYPDDHEPATPQVLAQTRARTHQPRLPRDGG